MPGGVRARRERGGVGKGARGVVQFRVGITLDFRGDVATSPALSLSPPLSPRRYPPPSLLHLRRPPTPPPPPAPPCLVFCHFSARRPPTPRTTGKEHPPRLSGRDRSFRARYPIYRPRYEHIASDDISPSLAFGLDAAVRRRPASWRRTGIMSRQTFPSCLPSPE